MQQEPDDELTGFPGDLHDALVRELRANVPSLDKSKATIVVQMLLRVFMRHYEAEAAKEAEGEG